MKVTAATRPANRKPSDRHSRSTAHRELFQQEIPQVVPATPHDKSPPPPAPEAGGLGGNGSGNGGTDGSGMPFQPIDPVEKQVALGQGRFERPGMTGQLTPLLVDPRPQCTVAHRQLQPAFAHSTLLW